MDKGSDIGAADLAFDPSNSRTLYANVWNARRTVWSQYAPMERPGSGLYKSTGGGDHWTQLSGHGLPESRWGRSGIAVAADGSTRVRALLTPLRARAGCIAAKTRARTGRTLGGRAHLQP